MTLALAVAYFSPDIFTLRRFVPVFLTRDYFTDT